jgi:hypothetical protein
MMPALNKVALSGASKVSVSGFSDKQVEAILSGASQAKLAIDASIFSADMSGASKLELIGSSSEIDIKSSGGSKILADNLHSDKLTISMSGASQAEMLGKTRIMLADLSGAARMSAYDYLINEASIDASGVSRAELFVSDRLDAVTSGDSKVYYKGNPVLGNKSNEASTTIDSVVAEVSPTGSDEKNLTTENMETEAQNMRVIQVK